mgnify:CR=1 FL=1
MPVQKFGTGFLFLEKMENLVENENILDVRGEICPYPMLKTNKELDAVNSPELTVLTDHSPALMTIPPQAIKRGYSCEIEETSQGEWIIKLTKQN